MSEKPEALYLADELEKLLILGDLGPNGNTAKTIRQLRRLYALCEEMGGVIEMVADLSSQEWQERDGTRKGATDNFGDRMWFISDSVMREVKKMRSKLKESK